jgi:hypothetical protein
LSLGHPPLRGETGPTVLHLLGFAAESLGLCQRHRPDLSAVLSLLADLTAICVAVWREQFSFSQSELQYRVCTVRACSGF